MSLPNYITLSRILLVPFFFTSLVSTRPDEGPQRWITLGIFLLASLTDALDGFIARVSKRRTALGRFLDPLADKLLLLSGYLGLLFVQGFAYQPPLWITVSIVFRDLVIVVGLVVIFLVNGTVRVEPNLIGKTTTALQMITLVLIFLEWLPAVIYFCYLTAFFTILSCLVYIVRDLRRLKALT